MRLRLRARALNWVALLGVALVASLLSGCSAPASIEIAPQPLMLRKRGEQGKLDVRVKDSQGRLLGQVKLIFTALTPEVLSVDGTGVVSALRSGDGAVLVRAGDVEGTAKIGVRIAKRIEIEPQNPVFNLGVGTDLRATIYDDRGDPMLAAKPVRWSISDPSIVSLDERGAIKTLKEGRATVTAYLDDIRTTTVVTVSHEKYDGKDGTWAQ